MKRVLRCVILVLAVMGVAASASATPTIIFMGDARAATISTNGGLQISDLNISWLDATDTPVASHLGSHIWHGALTFGANNVMSMYGDVASLPASGLLLTGIVQGWQWQGDDLLLWGSDALGPSLLSAFGFPADKVFDGFTLFIRNAGNGLYRVEDLTTASAPEPSSLLLFGSGLFGLSTIIRRRLRR